MKRKKTILEGLAQYPHFDNEALKTVVERFGLSDHSVNAYLRESSIIRLKRDFYIHRERSTHSLFCISYL